MPHLDVALPPGVFARDVDLDDLDDLRTCVTIGRTDPADCRERQIYATLDRSRRVVLVFGESVTLEVPPGRHRLRIHNTLFWKTIDFSIELGEHLEFTVINSARWWTYGMAGLLGSAPLFLTVRKSSIL